MISQGPNVPPLNISSDHHCPKDQAHAWQAKPLLTWFKQTLWQLHPCLPNPLLPFTMSLPQENGYHCFLNTLGSLMLLSLCPCPSFFVSLETFYAFFKTQHKCISLNPSPVTQGRTAHSLFLFMGKELYMPVFMYLQHSVEYRRHLSLLLAWEWTD